MHATSSRPPAHTALDAHHSARFYFFVHRRAACHVFRRSRGAFCQTPGVACCRTTLGGAGRADRSPRSSERKRYSEHGFGVDVILPSGTYSFSSAATFDTVVNELQSREAHLADSSFHFVCRQLPTADAEADHDLVHILKDEHFDGMKRAYEVAGYSALPVCRNKMDVMSSGGG